MSSTALFAAPSKANEASYLYQFQAGKLVQDGKLVTADPRKGCAYLYVSQKSVLHFCWFDRATGMVEDNFVIQPENSSFKKVNQCKDGRVYRLKTGDRRFFLWIQGANKEDDNRICEHMKMHLSNNSKNNNELIPGFNKLSEKDLLNLLSMGVYGDLNTPIRSYASKGGSSGKPKSKIQLDDLRNIMSSIGGSSQDTTSAAKEVDLNNVINAENVKTILEKPEAKESLVQFLPSLPSNSEESLLDLVKDKISDPITHIRSAQFKSALNSFNNALHRGGLGELVGQFNMGPKVTEAANKGNIREFVKALEEQMKESKDDKMDTT